MARLVFANQKENQSHQTSAEKLGVCEKLVLNDSFGLNAPGLAIEGSGWYPGLIDGSTIMVYIFFFCLGKIKQLLLLPDLCGAGNRMLVMLPL
jgi:hypothetical protein